MSSTAAAIVEDAQPSLSGNLSKWKAGWRISVLWALGAAGCFHIAYASPVLSVVIVGYAYCLVQIVRAQSTRVAFYCGLGTGMLVAAPQLSFFFTIFSFAAIPLWLVLAFWTGLFCALGRACTA